MMKFSHFVLVCALLTSISVFVAAGTAYATVPYAGLSGGVPGGVGPGLAPPSIVPGKEYSHNFDMDASGLLSSEQVIAWDGSGGVADGLNYVGTRPNFTILGEVDALANRRDHLYKQLISNPNAPTATDEAHLLFSVDDTYVGYGPGGAFVGVLPSAGPIVLPIGTIAGAGEISYELAGAFSPPSTVGTWAVQDDVNKMPRPIDVDGLEVWGPEPALTGDANKYSLDTDVFGLPPGGGVSVWNLLGTPYILQSTIASAVGTLLDLPTVVDPEIINLDALMVQDVTGDPDIFERDPTGGGDNDSIIFSIRQIPDGVGSYYATGSELFVLDGAGSISFLEHGGHVWDLAYALTAFDVWFEDQNNYGVLDINAIEAISESVVPEPASCIMLLLGLVGLSSRAKRRRS